MRDDRRTPYPPSVNLTPWILYTFWIHFPGKDMGLEMPIPSPPPPVDGMTDTCENFIFPQLRWRPLNVSGWKLLFDHLAAECFFSCKKMLWYTSRVLEGVQLILRMSGVLSAFTASNVGSNGGWRRSEVFVVCLGVFCELILSSRFVPFYTDLTHASLRRSRFTVGTKQGKLLTTQSRWFRAIYLYIAQLCFNFKISIIYLWD